MNKICNRCGVKNLTWNIRHHEKTGKWQLIDHKNKDGKWCVRNKSQPLSQNNIKIILCDLCTGTSFGLCRGESEYEKHMKMYHPENEVLTELDWNMRLTPKEKVSDGWSCDPHYKKYQNNRFIS